MSNIERIYTTPCGQYWVEHETGRVSMAPVTTVEDFLTNEDTVSAPDRYLVQGHGFNGTSMLHGGADNAADAIAEADRLAVAAREQAEIVAKINAGS